MNSTARQRVSFPAEDGGIVHADLYGQSSRGVVLAHGLRFNKESWEKQAQALENAGFRVLAIDFRGYGQSHGGSASQSPYSGLYFDVLAAVRHLRQSGATTVSVIGASMGGGAAAEAAIEAAPGEIDRLVLLAPATVKDPKRMKVPSLFITSRGDALADQIRQQYEAALEPKGLFVVDGSAHAQLIFETEQGQPVMDAILRFLSAS